MGLDIFIKIVLVAQFLMTTLIAYYLIRERNISGGSFVNELRNNLLEQNERIKSEFRRLFEILERQDYKSFFQNLDRFESLMMQTQNVFDEQRYLLKDLTKQQDYIGSRIQSLAPPSKPSPEANLQDKLQIISTVTSDVAHTLKTPLSGIKVSLELLKRELNVEGSQRITTLESGVRMLEETIAGYSQLGLMPTTTTQEHINIKDAIESTFKILALSTTKKVNLSFSIPDEIFMPHKLYSCLIISLVSILRNSFEAVSDNGIIKITIGMHKKLLFIKIYNNGPLISASSLDIYARGVSTKNSSGIGLTIAKEVIEGTLKGKLSHKNEIDGVSFIVEIPRTKTWQATKS